MASYQNPRLNNNKQFDLKIVTSVKLKAAFCNVNPVRFHLGYNNKNQEEIIYECLANDLEGFHGISEGFKTPDGYDSHVEYDIYFPLESDIFNKAVDLAFKRRNEEVDEEVFAELRKIQNALIWKAMDGLYRREGSHTTYEPRRVCPPLPTKEEKEREKQQNLLKVVSDTKFVRVHQAQQQRPSSLRTLLFYFLSVLALLSLVLLFLFFTSHSPTGTNDGNNHHGCKAAYWHQMNMDEECGGSKQERRPYLSALYETLPEAEKCWIQIIYDIAKKVNQIQNAAGLGESKVRDLNDEFNKLLREKDHWERRIWQLGGPNYSMHGSPRMSDNEGKEIRRSSKRCKYFGAAKDSAGVRELFEPEPELTGGSQRKTSGEVMRDVDADYYGYRNDDNDDGVLEPFEKTAETTEAEAIAHLEQEYKSTKQEAKGKTLKLMTDVDEEEEEESELSQESKREDNVKNYFIQVPHQEEIERKRIIAVKKKALG